MLFQLDRNTLGRGFAPRTRANTGFTFVEITVILAILLIIAAAVVPNLVAFERSRTLKDLEGNIARLPIEAKNEAIKAQTPVDIRIQDTTLVMEHVAEDGTQTQVKSIDLGTSIKVDSVQLNGKTSDPGSWQWTVYPDGSADSGGIQFSEDTAPKSLILPASGDPRWVSGELPDQSQDQWPAGQLQQR